MLVLCTWGVRQIESEGLGRLPLSSSVGNVHANVTEADDEERRGLGEQVDVEEVAAEHDVVDGAVQEEESHEDLHQVDSDATEVSSSVQVRGTLLSLR